MDEFYQTPDTGLTAGIQPEPAPEPDYEENRRNAKNAYSSSYLVIAFYGLIGEGIVFLIAAILKGLGVLDDLPKSVKYIINFLPMYVIAFPLMWMLGKRLETAPPKKHDMNFGQWVLAFIMGFACMISGAIIGNIVNLVLAAVFGIKIDASALNDGLLGEGAWTLTFFAVCCAPIIEEMIFRKFLIDRVRKYGEGTAILLSGISFGLFHGNFSQCFYAAFLGLFWAFIYVRTGKIQYTIALHMAVNFCGSVITGTIMRSIDYEGFLAAATSGDINEILEILPTIIPMLVFLAVEYALALAGLILFLVNLQKFRVSPPEAPVRKGELAKAVCLNAGIIAFLVLCIALFVYTAMSLFGKS